jgi:hypothetical protein
MDPGMDQMMELYAVVAERATGFWINLPVRTGRTVSRGEWLRLHRADPCHFQIITFAPNLQPPDQQIAFVGTVVALSVRWSDEMQR